MGFKTLFSHAISWFLGIAREVGQEVLERRARAGSFERETASALRILGAEQDALYQALQRQHRVLLILIVGIAVAQAVLTVSLRLL